MNVPITTPETEAQTQIDGDSRRSADRLKGYVLWFAAFASLAAGAYWLHQRATHVYTEDARIASEMILISAKIPGQILELPVSQGDSLNGGDWIAQIDDREAKLVLAELEAEFKTKQATYEKVEAQIRRVDRESGGHLQATRSQLNAALAGLAAARSDLEFKQNEWDRAQSLLSRKIISTQAWEDARNAHQQSSQHLQRAEAEVESARAAVTEAEGQQTELAVLAKELRALEHEQERIEAQIQRQRVVIENLRISAPSAGIVDKVFVDNGEYVVTGQRLALMHELNNIWVDANIRETQIRHLHIGAPVDIRVDAYPRKRFTGEVIRIGNTATSQFAFLPNTNPSGNFTKVTQRIPIKISIEQVEDELKPGMMVEVAIEID